LREDENTRLSGYFTAPKHQGGVFCPGRCMPRTMGASPWALQFADNSHFRILQADNPDVAFSAWRMPPYPHPGERMTTAIKNSSLLSLAIEGFLCGYRSGTAAPFPCFQENGFPMLGDPRLFLFSGDETTRQGPGTLTLWTVARLFVWGGMAGLKTLGIDCK
jgi:hypothetical protein